MAPFPMARQRTPLRAADILPTLHRSLPASIATLLGPISERAEAAGMSLYLVGGPVRDALLNAPVKDLDLVVDGDVQSLACRLAADLGGTVLSRSQFGTAALRIHDQRLDLVTARRESYPRPGALPKVTASSIEDDLARRDFSVNSMAVPLLGPCKGELLDPHGGRQDLAEGFIRILHQGSFVDDPTRVLRAVRYEQRLGFRLEKGTSQKLSEAVDGGALGTLSGDRLRRELALMLRESNPNLALLRCGELGVLTAVHPALGDVSAVTKVAETAEESGPLIYLAALCHGISAEEGESLIQRLRMPVTWARVVRDTIAVGTLLSREVPGLLPANGVVLSPSDVYVLLDPYAPEAVWVNMLMAESPAAREALESYLTTLRYVKPILDGRDLVSMGLPQGPLVGEVLRELRSARMDGKVTTREGEVKLVERYVPSGRLR